MGRDTKQEKMDELVSYIGEKAPIVNTQPILSVQERLYADESFMEIYIGLKKELELKKVILELKQINEILGPAVKSYDALAVAEDK